jgi:hypothetical protein
MLQIVWQLAWMVMRRVLPYSDLARRARIRRNAFRLVTCTPWPGDGATGTDAAHLALLRTLWLQRETRRAVRSRRDEPAALLARAALESYILGAYCIYAEDAVRILVAADNRAMRRVLAYLTEDDLLSQAAINDAADVIGVPGRDLKFAEAAEWLEREHGYDAPLSLYRRYYVPLSHFYAHPSASTLMRHVWPDGKPHRRPARAWARRSPARLADASAGLLAAAIAEKAGVPSARFIKYAEAHIDRAFTPAGTVAGKGMRQAVEWRRLPEVARIIMELRRYTHGPAALADDLRTRERRIRGGFESAFMLLRLDLPDGAFGPAIDAFTTQVLDSLDEPPDGAAEKAAT